MHLYLASLTLFALLRSFKIDPASPSFTTLGNQHNDGHGTRRDPAFVRVFPHLVTYVQLSYYANPFLSVFVNHFGCFPLLTCLRINQNSTRTSRVSTATSLKDNQHKNGLTQVILPLFNQLDTSSDTSFNTSTTKSSRPDLHHLTEANLQQHRQRYDDAAVTLKEKAQTRKLQKVGFRLGFDLPLRRYEKEKWQPHGWIEERAISGNRR